MPRTESNFQYIRGLKLDIAAPVRQQHSAWLDWIRGGLALLVLLNHARLAVFVDYADMMPQHRTLAVKIFVLLGRLGNEAVIVFFVLSGFLVGGPLIDKVLTGKFFWRSFAIDRISRLYVPLVPALAFSGLVMLATQEGASPLQLLGHLFSTQGIFVDCIAVNAPLWSLAYEAWFYAAAGAVAAFFQTRSAVTLSIAAVAFAMLLSLNPAYLAIWCIGVFAFRVRFTSHRAAYFYLLLLITAIGLGFNQLSMPSKSMQTIVIPRAIPQLILAMGAAGLTSWLRDVRSSKRAAKAAAAIAAPSYTLYLTHYPMIELIRKSGLTRHQISFYSASLFLAVCTTCVLTSLAFYFAFERNSGKVRLWARKCLV